MSQTKRLVVNTNNGYFVSKEKKPRKNRCIGVVNRTSRTKELIVYSRMNERHNDSVTDSPKYKKIYELKYNKNSADFYINVYNEDQISYEIKVGIGIDSLIEFDLSKKRFSGLYVEEVMCFLLEKTRDFCQDFKNKIIYDWILFNGTEEDLLDGLNSLTIEMHYDFRVILCFDGVHFTTAIIHETTTPGQQKEFFIFDSDYEEGRFPNIKQVIKEKIQGESRLCGLFAAEFIIEAVKYENFDSLKQNCFNNKIQNLIISETRRYIKSLEKDFNEILKLK